MNYTPNIYSEYRSRNILSLADRVEVIREHSRHLTPPSLQSLARKFDCSSKQIKNILMNRDSILESHRNGDPGPQKDVYIREDAMQKRQDKIAFLGKVMYEYIQRMLYFNQSIDDQKFRLKALQIKECIAVENFQPTNAWLEDFKKTYGIPGFDLQSLRNNIVITEAKRPHLTVIDMIQYVSSMEQGSDQDPNCKNLAGTYPKADINGNARFNSRKKHSSLEPRIIYEIEEDEEDEELQKLHFDDPPELAAQHYSSPNANKYTSKRRASSTFPDIESADDALKHVRALEEYAMLHDNFRAIGLLTQLEQIFQKKVENK